jgi:hypothetical protein
VSFTGAMRAYVEHLVAAKQPLKEKADRLAADASRAAP